MYKFHEQKSTKQIPRKKLSTQRAPYAKSVSGGEKLMYKFHHEKNTQSTICEQKPARNKFQEQKSECKSHINKSVSQ